MPRLFTGLSIPDDYQRKLFVLQGGVPGARWITPENFHVTLTFIGDVPDDTAETVDEVLQDIRHKPFTLELKGAGFFSRGDHTTHLWAGVAESEPLRRLKDKIDRALEKYRVPFEKRKYTPHLTLARLRHADEARLAGFVQDHAQWALPPFDVGGFHLYQSHRGTDAAMYDDIAFYPFG